MFVHGPMPLTANIARVGGDLERSRGNGIMPPVVLSCAGRFRIADVFYAPVAFRFQTYERAADRAAAAEPI